MIATMKIRMWSPNPSWPPVRLLWEPFSSLDAHSQLQPLHCPPEFPCLLHQTWQDSSAKHFANSSAEEEKGPPLSTRLNNFFLTWFTFFWNLHPKDLPYNIHLKQIGLNTYSLSCLLWSCKHRPFCRWHDMSFCKPVRWCHTEMEPGSSSRQSLWCWLSSWNS